MKSTIRQTRGPGMNLGLKKPRFGFSKPKAYVEPEAIAKARKASGASGKSSYLPDGSMGGDSGPVRKPKAPKVPKSKIPSSKKL